MLEGLVKLKTCVRPSNLKFFISVHTENLKSQKFYVKYIELLATVIMIVTY